VINDITDLTSGYIKVLLSNDKLFTRPLYGDEPPTVSRTWNVIIETNDTKKLDQLMAADKLRYSLVDWTPARRSNIL